MGRGDKKTRRGKIYRGSFGNSRPHRSSKIGSVGKASGKTAGKRASGKKAS